MQFAIRQHFVNIMVLLLACFQLSLALAQETDVLLPQNNVMVPDATFDFTYDMDMPQEAIDVVEHCFGILSSYFNSAVPIKGHVHWKDIDGDDYEVELADGTTITEEDCFNRADDQFFTLFYIEDENGSIIDSTDACCTGNIWTGEETCFLGNDKLGMASPNWGNALVTELVDILPDDSPLNTIWDGELEWWNGDVVGVTQALHNSLLGDDLYPFSDDIEVKIDSDENWDFSLDGSGTGHSFKKVILHELIHGLGFAPGGWLAPWSDQSEVFFPPVPSIYLQFLQYGDIDPLGIPVGESLLDMSDPTAAVTDTTTLIFWNGPKAREANGGNNPRMNAWDAIVPGTTLSHLDTIFSYSCGLHHEFPLMFSSDNDSQSFDVIDPVTMGVMEDIGWDVDCPNPGCSNSYACNYDWLACPNSEDLWDQDDCIYGDTYYIPTGTLPQDLIWSCSNCPSSIDPSYFLADSPCVQDVLQNTVGSQLEWTDERQAAYECCLNVGCKNDAYCNYNPTVCNHDISLCMNCPPSKHCLSLELMDASGNGWEGATYTIITLNSMSVEFGTLGSGFQGVDFFCLEEGCYELQVTSGQNPQEISWVLSGISGTPPLSSSNNNIGTFPFAVGPSVVGCTDPFACNYDGACVEPLIVDPFDVYATACNYPKCTNPSACNYAPSDCHDESLCLFGADDSAPTIFTEVNWDVSGSVEVTYPGGPFGDPLTIDEPILQLVNFDPDLTFQGEYPDNLLFEGDWTVCNSNFTFFDGLYEYRGVFYSDEETQVYGDVFSGNDEVIGWFNMVANAYGGCMDLSACNYDIYAQIHDEGSCIFELCNDPIACNYNEDECVQEQCIYDAPAFNFEAGIYSCVVDLSCDGEVDQDLTLSFSSQDSIGSEWVQSSYSICGNTLSILGIYSENSTTLIQAELLENGQLSEFGSIWVSGVSGCVYFTPINEGCSDPVACNYDSEVDQENGSCVYPTCTDVASCNYNLDGGCSDNALCVYYTNDILLSSDWRLEKDFLCNEIVNEVDIVTFSNNMTVSESENPNFSGSWSFCGSGISIHVVESYESDYSGSFNAVEGFFEGEFATTQGGQGCFKLVPVIYGCSDDMACNYNAIANVSDNSCQYEEPQFEPFEEEWQLYFSCDLGEDGMMVTFDLDYTWTASVFGYNGIWHSCGLSLTVYHNQVLIFEGEWHEEVNSFVGVSGNGECARVSQIIYGCTNESASNYLMEANSDDGSCVFNIEGCTDPLACNYYEPATTDDGSCIMPDECGICDGPGPIYECGCSEIPAGDCDCEGNQQQPSCPDPLACNYFPVDDGICLVDDLTSCLYLDAVGVCGGTCTDDVDLDGLCDDLDDCLPESEYFGCNTCFTPVSFQDTLDGGESLDVDLVFASGVLSSLSLNLQFQPIVSDISWPGDLIIEIVNPQGDCIQLGGFNVPGDCSTSIGNYTIYPSVWSETTAGLYQTVIDIEAVNQIEGHGFWSVRFVNGYSSSYPNPVNYHAVVKLFGLCPVYQSATNLSNTLCGPGTIYNETLHQCVPVDFTTCQSDLDNNGVVATSDLLIFLSDFGIDCP